MIRLELQGGLGNQLFIWAMAHHLSEHFNEHVQITYPISKNNRSDRPCELVGLNEFCVHDISISTSKSLPLITKFIDKINSIIWVTSIIQTKRFGVFTESLSGDTTVDYIRPPKLIRGYFQNTEMVSSASAEIAPELIAFLESIAVPDELKIDDINVVAHIRRGDTKSISKEFGVLSLKYYKQNLGSDLSVVICTDERTNLAELHNEFPFASFITPNESTSWQTLKILSSAKKLVMANSTLSWWGAWIAKQRENTEIIFPSPWRPLETQDNKAILMSNVVFTNSIFDEDKSI
jgi:hypothetical protein